MIRKSSRRISIFQISRTSLIFVAEALNNLILSYYNLFTKTFPYAIPFTRYSFYDLSVQHDNTIYILIILHQLLSASLTYDIQILFPLNKDDIPFPGFFPSTVTISFPKEYDNCFPTIHRTHRNY
jgi:hypothetical protein